MDKTKEFSRKFGLAVYFSLTITIFRAFDMMTADQFLYGMGSILMLYGLANVVSKFSGNQS